MILAVILPVVFFGFAAYRDWRNIETEAETRISHMRDAVTEHASRVFRTHQLVAYSIRDRIATSTWDRIAASADLHDYLAEISSTFPEVQAIWLIDGEGDLRAASREFPAGVENLSDRAWFVELRDGAEEASVGMRGGGVLAEPRSFSLNFRRDANGSNFDGLVQIAVPPRYFEDFYASSYPEAGVIALVDRDGNLLIRYPEDTNLKLQLGPESLFFTNIAASPAGSYSQRSTVDGVMRYYGYARVADFPLYVGLGLGQQELYRLWRTRLQSYGTYFIPAGFALLILSLYAWRSHRDLENIVELRTSALSMAIAEKNQLLKEVHHRVKNNMQIISSLIRMQERVQTSPDETIRRVQAMALVHDLIYTHDEFASVDLAAYTHRMLETIIGRGDIVFDLDLEPATVALDRAMPFALILSEIVTNATRHAFPEGRGRISIALRRVSAENGGWIELCVNDDGVGHNPEVDGRGFGMRLVKSLAVQLNAELRFERHDGTRFRMTFPVVAAGEQIA